MYRVNLCGSVVQLIENVSIVVFVKGASYIRSILWTWCRMCAFGVQDLRVVLEVMHWNSIFMFYQAKVKQYLWHQDKSTLLRSFIMSCIVQHVQSVDRCMSQMHCRNVTCILFFFFCSSPSTQILFTCWCALFCKDLDFNMLYI